jgi:hypothetical protein
MKETRFSASMFWQSIAQAFDTVTGRLKRCNSAETMRILIAIVVLAGLVLLGSRARHSTESTYSRQLPATVSVVQGGVDPQLAILETLVPPIKWQPGGELVSLEENNEFTPGPLATFHPHGEEVCASGCAASHHPTEQLTDRHFEQLLADYSVEPIAEAGEAFETLLFYGRQVIGLLDRNGSGPLDPLRAAVLRQELGRGHAELAIRIVDESGVVRAILPPTSVPLDRRHEFKLVPHNLQPLIASGTVKRVGRDHLWMRL